MPFIGFPLRRSDAIHTTVGVAALTLAAYIQTTVIYTLTLSGKPQVPSQTSRNRRSNRLTTYASRLWRFWDGHHRGVFAQKAPASVQNRIDRSGNVGVDQPPANGEMTASERPPLTTFDFHDH